MFARLGPAQPAQGADVISRAVAAAALAALAVIHVVDLPGTLGPTPLVGAGYLGIIAAAVVTGGVMITRSHWPNGRLNRRVLLNVLVDSSRQRGADEAPKDRHRRRRPGRRGGGRRYHGRLCQRLARGHRYQRRLDEHCLGHCPHLAHRREGRSDPDTATEQVACLRRT
jgi:hypothetical protein